MKISAFKRLQQQDYPKTYKDLMNGLFDILNSFMEQVSQALTRRLTYSDNFDCVNATLTLTAPVTNLKIKNTQGGIMGGCQILNVTPVNAQEILTSAPFAQFLNSGDGQLIVKTITGLTPGNTYNVTLLFTR